MKRMPKLNVILAGVGCASLLFYILACSTSFSPDDSQVLYPAFDNQSGAISIAVYDRKTGRSETIFTAVAPGETRTDQDLLLARAQWLPDGKHVLIGHVLTDDDQGLSLFVVPRGVNEPIRHLLVPDLDEPAVEIPQLGRPADAIAADQVAIGPGGNAHAVEIGNDRQTRGRRSKVIPLDHIGVRIRPGEQNAGVGGDEEGGTFVDHVLDEERVLAPPAVHRAHIGTSLVHLAPPFGARKRRK